MKRSLQRVVGPLLLLAISILAGSLPQSVFAQQNRDVPGVRSRSESMAERRRVERVFPEFSRALRVLRLKQQKVNEVQNLLRHYESDTRLAREEWQQLSHEQRRQEFVDPGGPPARATELRTGLQQSIANLRAEIKNLLTPQENEQFDRLVHQMAQRRELTNNIRQQKGVRGRIPSH